LLSLWDLVLVADYLNYYSYFKNIFIFIFDLLKIRVNQRWAASSNRGLSITPGSRPARRRRADPR
jgi:hypothetical protein